MKNLVKISVISLIAMFVLVSCKSEVKTETGSTIIPLEKFEEMAPNFVNKTVVTSGIVDHICKHGGKKLLLVSDDFSLHIFAEERFSDDIVGQIVEITGTLGEDIIDEATFQQWEDDASTMEEHERKMGILDYVSMMRDSLQASGKDHFSDYYITYISHKVTE